VTSGLPLTGSDQLAQVAIEGAARPEPGQELMSEYRTATNGYFDALRVPLLKGAWLPDPAALPGVRYALVSDRLARAAWPAEDPIGRRLKLARYDVEAPWHTVVGVVGDTRHTALDVATRPQVYTHQARYPTGQMGVVLRTAGDPVRMAPSVRGIVAALEPAAPVTRVRTMGELMTASVAGRRFHMFVIGAFAVLALVLAVVGLYAVIAYSVAERIHEMCVRLALGARPATLLGMVLGEGMKLVGLGVLIGVLAALALTRLIESQLFGVEARDLRTFVLVPLVLAFVGLLGCLIPALRAMRVDPASALRGE
jgi:predicted permease